MAAARLSARSHAPSDVLFCAGADLLLLPAVLWRVLLCCALCAVRVLTTAALKYLNIKGVGADGLPIVEGGYRTGAGGWSSASAPHALFGANYFGLSLAFADDAPASLTQRLTVNATVYGPAGPLAAEVGGSGGPPAYTLTTSAESVLLSAEGSATAPKTTLWFYAICNTDNATATARVELILPPYDPIALYVSKTCHYPAFNVGTASMDAAVVAYVF
jgi:hypothetical protein